MDYRIEQLRYQLREDPSSRLFFQLGELLRKEGRPDEAVRILSEGLDKHPRYVAAWVSLGRALLTLGNHQQAEEALERALELDPENGVAARVVGEAAIARGDWLRAVKALKLARGLSPRDRALDERIRYVEARLEERGELVRPAPPAAIPVVSAPREREVVSLSAEDPFAVRSQSDTGVWQLEGDVFEAGWVADVPEPEIEGVAAETVPGVTLSVDFEDLPEPAETVPGTTLSVELEDLPEPADEDAQEAAAESAARVELPASPADHEAAPVTISDYESELDEEGSGVTDEAPASEEEQTSELEEIPLPTMTLARLAVEQGDRDLAEKTLHSMLARNPEHEEAARLLAELTAAAAEEPSLDEPENRGEATARALQGWLSGVRLAAERLAR